MAGRAGRGLHPEAWTRRPAGDRAVHGDVAGVCRVWTQRESGPPPAEVVAPGLSSAGAAGASRAPPPPRRLSGVRVPSARASSRPREELSMVPGGRLSKGHTYFFLNLKYLK